MSLVEKVFRDTPAYAKAAKTGMEDVMSRTVGGNSLAEFLAAFLDGVLKGKRGKEKLSDAHVEENLDLTAKLFDCVHVRAAPPSPHGSDDSHAAPGQGCLL